MTIKIPTSFVPRDYQIPMWEALVTKETCKRAVLVWPRRAGKDLTCLNSLAVHALTKRVGNYYYFAPTYQQGKKIIWDGKDRTGRPFLKVFPGYPLTQSEDPSSMILSMDKREMKIYLTNGSMFQVIGTENEDSLVGTNPVGCVFSEYSVMNSKAWELVRPILRENGGFALFTYTARGRNHGYRLYETNKNNPRWHVELHTCETLLHDGKRVITQEMIDEEIEDGMDEDLVRQEYYNDFYASNQGAYYARQMRRALDEGRITTVPWNPQIPVHTAWDLGRRDSTAIWFFQVDYNGNVNLIETYDRKNAALTDHIKFAQAKPYVYGTHFGPHDLAQHEFTTNKTRIETAFSLGFRFTIVPKIPVTDGIDAVRTVLPRCRFDAQKCDPGIEALRQYTKEETGQLGLDGKPIYQDKPKHDWCFTGDTEVLTHNGTYPIMKIPTEGKVFTSCGWKPYTNRRLVKKNAPLVEVVFNDGNTVRCTPDHLFKTGSGWKSAESLLPSTLILSSLTPSLNTLMAAFTVFGRGIDISQEEESLYTDRLGKEPLGTSQNPAISTTGMETQITTLWKIWSALMDGLTYLKTGRCTRKGEQSSFPKEQKTKLPSGTLQKLEDSGTVEMQSDQKVGKNGGGKICRASFVGRFLTALSGSLGILKNTVTQTARPLRIEQVRELPESEDVWCITVPELEEFSLFNGALVHNCSDYADAFRYLAIAVDQVLCDNTYTDSTGEVVAMPDTIIYDHNLLEF